MVCSIKGAMAPYELDKLTSWQALDDWHRGLLLYHMGHLVKTLSEQAAGRI